MYNDVILHADFTKVDKDQKIVEGFATTEAVDSQGEVVSADAVDKALDPYMKFPTIREMHQWSAVGKTLEAKTEKGEKNGLWIRGKIVDNEAWEKVKEGVYNGFSIGGKVVKKVGNIIQELVLNEISLVDRPANPEAVFSLVKMKGGKVIEKQAPTEATGMLEDIPYVGVKIAEQLISMANNLSYIIELCQSHERSTKHLEKIIKYLKQAAMAELEVEKRAIEGKTSAEKKETLEKLLRAKVALEKLVKLQKPGWEKGYFNQLTKAL